MEEPSSQTPRVTMYVLTNMYVFERKVYQFLGVGTKRAIKLRSLLYFLGAVAGMFIWRHLPFLNVLVSWIPMLLAYIGVPIGVAYLVGGVYTENRNSLKYFRSLLTYMFRKQKREAFYGGKLVKKPNRYQLKGTYQVKAPLISKPKTQIWSLQGLYTIREGS
ncbi:hypothetical protein [Listeria valentina]|uniref:hypothetical protein n=1 Tax=Listeria valentina TaxID=2705293 RepID=UPI001430FDDF|nr:hypothetical protein [Listeria valentina]